MFNNTQWFCFASGPGKPCVQMIDVKEVDEARFATEYAPEYVPALKAAGAFPEVVCSPNIQCLRGNAKPNFIVIHAWASTDAFKTFYNHGKCLVIPISFIRSSYWAFV